MTDRALDAFLTDKSDDAYTRVVDRLLASPRFGERWARHWLDVARYADTKGYVFQEDRNYKGAFAYRDWVIASFNNDRPFDRFVVEQIAGDLLPAATLADRQRQLVATTFLVLGNHNLEEQDKKQLRMDVVDEQLDAISKAFLAQTVTCARCHDHKFDPIPTRDYYALAGILANAKTLEHANVSKWLELPLPQEPAIEVTLARHEAAVAALEKEIKIVQDTQRGIKSPAVVALKDLPGIVVDDQQAKVVGEWTLSQSVKPYLGKGQKTITLQPEITVPGRYEVRLAYTPGDNRSPAVPVTVFSADGEQTITVNQQQRPPIDGLFLSLGQFRFEANGQGFVLVSTGDTTGHVVVDGVQFLPLDGVTVTSADDAPADAAAVKADRDTAAQLAKTLAGLQQQLKELKSTGPVRPKFMSVEEEKEITDLRIHIRGTVHHLGETVPRGFLQVATSGESPRPGSDQSGRRELGEWIAGPSNPLTARVLANRVWQGLLGTGLSRTPDNFGTTGEPPSHPELLDHLAVRLQQRGWSVKSLVRSIVQSETYRQSSAGSLSDDPENRWLSHQNRRRLDAECLLDAMLTVSGERDDRLGGRTIPVGLAEDYSLQQGSRRRAVYWPVFRNTLPEIFEAFDFADPSLPSGSRNVSTVAPQALFFLNDDWVSRSAKQAAERLLDESWPSDRERTDRLFRLAVGRPPSDREAEIVQQSLRGGSSVETWTAIVQAVFGSIDFRYVE